MEDSCDDLVEFLGPLTSRRASLYMGTCSFSDILEKNVKTADELEEEQRGENESGWGTLPDLIIEKVLSYLSIPQRYSASMTCRQWQRAFYMQGTWKTFRLEDNTLTRHKFNYYMGWQLILDHLRTQVCIFRIGRFIRSLIFSPMSNLFNLYEFMNLLSYYSERYNEDEKSRAPLHIYSLRFIFRCDLATREEQSVYGTGGKLLEALQRLMTNLSELRNLELIDLLLDSTNEAIHLLDDVCASLCGTLDRLVLINTTRGPLDLLHPACFINLRILKISPPNLGTEVVELLCQNLRLLELHLIQNNYTDMAVAVDHRAWAKAKFKVFLRTMGKTDKEILWQPGAPVVSIIYDSPSTKVNWASMLTIIDLYSTKVEEYGHLGLPKFGRSKKFEDRADCMLVTITRKCPYLTTMYIRERISTSTVLLIVSISSNLQNFFIRRKALLLKCDLKQHNLALDANFSQWIVENSKTYERMTKGVAHRLGQCDWTPLTDVKFKEMSKQKEAY